MSGLPPGLTPLPAGLTPLPKREGLAADSGVANGLPSAGGAGMQHVGAAIAGTASNVGRALDAQRFGLAKAVSGKTTTDDQMTALRQHIPAWLVGGLGMRDEQGRPVRTADDMYQMARRNPLIIHGNPIGSAGGHAPDINLTQMLSGAVDTGLQTVTDPLTYETLGLAPLARGVQVALRAANNATHFTPMVIRSLQSLHATPFGQKLATLMGPTVHGSADLGKHLYEAVHDFVHWGGEVKRTLGTQTWNRIRGAANYGSSNGFRVQQHLMRRFDEITKGLTDEERVRVGQALNGEIHPERPSGYSVDEIPDSQVLTDKERSAYRQLRTLTDLDYKLRFDAAQTIAFRNYTRGMSEADKAVVWKALKDGKPPEVPQSAGRVRSPDLKAQEIENRSRAINAKRPTQFIPQEATGIAPDTLPKPSMRYTFKPQNQAEIDHAQMLLDKYNEIHNTVLENMPKRENYMPAAPSPKGEPTRTETISQVSDFDPRAQHREEIKVTSANQVRQGFEAMARNTNRRVTAGAITQALGDLLDDPAVNKLFEKTIRATGNARTAKEKFRDAWLAAVGYPRAAVVSITPRHVANILDLLANTVPPQHLAAVMKDTMSLAGKLIEADEKEYAALTREGRELGAISGAFTERKPFFQKIPGTNIPTDVTVGGKQFGVGAWTRFNNKLVWAVDEAAKQTYAKLLMETGEAMHPLEAGGMAASRLVDYEHTAPLIQKFMRYVAPFGTFRGSIPGAVAGGIARNPARAALLNRATGGAMYGGKGDKEGGITMHNPTADVGRLLDYTWNQQYRDADTGIADYARGSFAAPVAGSLNAAQDMIGKPGHWASYGQSWFPKRKKDGSLDLGFLADSALAGVPEAQAILESMGIGRFKWKGLAQEATMQTTGITLPNTPPMPGGPGSEPPPQMQP